MWYECLPRGGSLYTAPGIRQAPLAPRRSIIMPLCVRTPRVSPLARVATLALATLLGAAEALSAAPAPADRALARDIYRELIELDTTPSGDTFAAARAMS